MPQTIHKLQVASGLFFEKFGQKYQGSVWEICKLDRLSWKMMIRNELVYTAQCHVFHINPTKQYSKHFQRYPAYPMVRG